MPTDDIVPLKLSKHAAYYRRHRERLKEASRLRYQAHGKARRREQALCQSELVTDCSELEYIPSYSDDDSGSACSVNSAADYAPETDCDFLADYISPHWGCAQYCNIFLRMELTRDEVNLWKARWGGMHRWKSCDLDVHGLSDHRELGNDLLFKLECLFEGDIPAPDLFELRAINVDVIWLTRGLVEGLHILDELLQAKPS